MTLTAPRPTEARGRTRSVLARAFGITAVMSAGGSLLGLFRDLLLARYFGAGQGTDAFLVAWTVPETAAPLLIEDAMAFLMVPAFSLALSAEDTPQDPQIPTPRTRLVRASQTLPTAPGHAPTKGREELRAQSPTSRTVPTAPSPAPTKGRGELRAQPPTSRTLPPPRTPAPAPTPAVSDLVAATLP
ncbi:hypothetical protein ACEZDJ_13180, partial [Streptacidiphilus sp. N1-5]